MLEKRTLQSNKKNNPTKKSAFKTEISFGGVSFTEKSIFAKHMAVMLRAGLTVNESLQITSESAKGKFKKVLQNILKSIQSGNSFAKSLGNFPSVFPGILVSAVYAGERSGTLIQNLENVSKELKKEKELVDKIRGAMIYPIVVLIATFILGLSLAFFVLPKIVPLFKGLRTDLPWTTELLIAFSDLVQDHGFILFFGIIFLTFFVVFLFRRKFMRPFTHMLLLKLPVVKHIVFASNLSRFCRTLGTLLQSGLPITEALDVTQKTVKNYYYNRSIEKISKRIEKGTKLSSELAAFPVLYPTIVTRMIEVGEQSGKMEETLGYLAEFYENEVDNATKSLSTAIEPILLLSIGLVVGFLALSIITPIYEITGNINK
jgi:type IV pilus assembly protein PilC